MTPGGDMEQNERPESPRGDRRRSGPARVKAEGQVEVHVDAVTPRELHAHLERVHERIGNVDDAVGAVELKFEQRFSRVEKLILGLGVAVASPKLGGPDLPEIAASLAGSLLGG